MFYIDYQRFTRSKTLFRLLPPEISRRLSQTFLASHMTPSWIIWLGLYRADCVWDLFSERQESKGSALGLTASLVLLFAPPRRSWTGWFRPPGGQLWWLVSATGLERGSEYRMADSAGMGFLFRCWSSNACDSSQTRVWFKSDRKKTVNTSHRKQAEQPILRHTEYTLSAHSLYLICMPRTLLFWVFQHQKLADCLSKVLINLYLSRSCWDRPRTCDTSTLISSRD